MLIRSTLHFISAFYHVWNQTAWVISTSSLGGSCSLPELVPAPAPPVTQHQGSCRAARMGASEIPPATYWGTFMQPGRAMPGFLVQQGARSL